MSNNHDKGMQKKIMPFNEKEIKSLKGLFTKVANKRNCDQSYVLRIAKGDRAINTEKAKLIHSDLKQLLTVLNS